MPHPFISALNTLAQQQQACLFLIDFECTDYHVQPLTRLDKDIFFNINGITNTIFPANSSPATNLKIQEAVSFERYQQAFNQVKQNFKNGNSYLLNLTFPTKIASSLSLQEIFYQSRAKFKLFFKDKFVVFSPERFIKIEQNTISTYPMKGTIDAAFPNAAHEILENPKELAEHTMVVDLLRNDLSMISKQVGVDKFRYLEKIRAGNTELLQVSSQISGVLPPNWQANLGGLLFTLLPAGSISGTPKRKTLEIIQQVEAYRRGFFTGIFGYFDGKDFLDSAVMIRFIERQDEQLIYKSGGGLTIDSDVHSEYQELLSKVYLPL
ncbi:MAG: aminodeoxychorismate synthase component I [Thiotrichaceae bacterium]|nr:aminodeoxychorismate synthase component I [Thiotrichaceae bacterium]